jgi:ABC-type Fe3+-siderophore transport system permease subunit
MKILAAIAMIMLFAGVISSVLYFMNYNLKILFWMYEMPETQQWLIRGGLIVAGLAILLIFKKKINAIK